MKKGKRLAIVTLNKTIKKKALLPSSSTQKAELIALTRALELGKGKILNIHTDYLYAFSILHAHGPPGTRKAC